MTSTKTAYAYTRVSSKSQASEDKTGLKRQHDDIKTFIEKHPEYQLSTRTYTDTASGYYGNNQSVSSGLDNFLKDCESGLVKRGDLLCLELIDRLSRQKPSVVKKLFSKIIDDYGVSIAIVKWDLIANAGAGDNELAMDLPADLLLTVGMHIAYKESKQKSDRVLSVKRISQEKARSEGKIMTRSCPAWLTVNKEKDAFIVDDSLVHIIKRMFELKVTRMGSRRIISELEKEGVTEFNGSPLRVDLIDKYLKMGAVIGRLQTTIDDRTTGKRVRKNLGEFIEDYYPRIISDDLFYAAQACFEGGQRGGSAGGKEFNNALVGLCKCYKCGLAMSLNIAKNKTTADTYYLRCMGTTSRKTCASKSIRYKEVLGAVMHFLSPDGSSSSRDDVSPQELNIQLDGLGEQIKQLNHRVSNIDIAISNTSVTGEHSSLMGLQQKLKKELDEVISKQTEIRALTNKDWLYELKSAIDLDMSNESGRRTFNTILKRYLSSIRIEKDRTIIGYKDHIYGGSTFSVIHPNKTNGYHRYVSVHHHSPNTRNVTLVDGKKTYLEQTHNEIIEDWIPTKDELLFEDDLAKHVSVLRQEFQLLLEEDPIDDDKVFAKVKEINAETDLYIALRESISLKSKN